MDDFHLNVGTLLASGINSTYKLSLLKTTRNFPKKKLYYDRKAFDSKVKFELCLQQKFHEKQKLMVFEQFHYGLAFVKYSDCVM